MEQHILAIKCPLTVAGDKISEHQYIDDKKCAVTLHVNY